MITINLNFTDDHTPLTTAATHIREGFKAMAESLDQFVRLTLEDRIYEEIKDKRRWRER
jgi:hypothetical protein